MKTLKTEIIINADKQKVWNTLMNHETYPSWNPFIKKISGFTLEGDYLEVVMQFEGKKPITMNPKVLRNKQESEFRWKGKLFVEGLFDGEHYFILEDLGNNQTKFIHGEIFSGVLAGAMMKMIGTQTKKGFIAMNTALKNISEIN